MATGQYSLILRTPEQLVIDITSTSIASTWEEWIDTLEMFFIASDINDTKQMRALLLYLVEKNYKKYIEHSMMKVILMKKQKNSLIHILNQKLM